ncbi:MAG: pilus assembly PilX N-terminal domain-containing protein [Betaproteobacteria bacterium]
MRRDHQAGIALASAIFLIVVLTGLGAIVVTVSGLQHTSSARDVMGSKAYQAARAGIEWGAYQVLQIPPLPAAGACPVSPTSIPMPAGTDLTGLTVQVTCARTTADEGSRTVAGGNPLEFYLITATACNQPACPNPAPGPSYVERQLQATIAR